MRFFFAGLWLLILPTLAFAQATGQVLSIGFGQGVYRPNCWTPMLVQLNPTTNDSGNYEIEIWQHDLDGDRPIYTRSIVLNGADQAPQQKFWTYFLPQPTDKGLPDQSISELQKDLQVFLCQPGSHKQIAKLPITSALRNVDPPVGGNLPPRGSKLILAVSTNGTKQATWSPLLPYDPGRASGFKENVEVVPVHTADLPEDPIGYEAVDAIVWMDGNPSDLSSGNQDTFNALKDYVRFGGVLIITQSTANWQEDQAFGDLMPVDLEGLATKQQFEPLRSMAQPHDPDPFGTPVDQIWASTKGPYQMARATTRPSALVDDWIDWKEDGSYSDATPYLTRKQYGLGQVIWVAQPLTMDAAPASSTGWGYVWDKVLGVRSDLYVVPDKQKSDGNTEVTLRRDRYEAGPPIDLGYTLVQGLNLNSRANWLILLAIVFFIGYWVVAGPGSYLYLAAKSRKHWSWFAFGVSALVAALITFAVVRLVLRGPPQINHKSFVRVAPNQPALVYTRFGLYIPRDGSQKISLDDTAASSVSYVSPFAEHPQQLGEVSEFLSPTIYYPAVRDLKSDTQPQLSVDYRSSSKKFQARWVGDLPAHFTGNVTLDPTDRRLPISGILTNASNIDLTDVYLAFRVSSTRDWLIYIPAWGKGVTHDIKRDFAQPFFVGHENFPNYAVPGESKVISDELVPVTYGWQGYWFGEFRHNGGDDPNVVKDNLNYIYPMLTLFDRIPAMPGSIKHEIDNTISVQKDRVDFLNRGARMLNASGSVAAGQLVIFGTAKGALPIPLEVDDEKMTGDGTTFYQFIFPMDRSGLDAPPAPPAATTKPTAQLTK